MFDGYALLIGVDENAVAPWALPAVAKDVAALASVLRNPERCGYADERIRILTGKSATRTNILQHLDWMREAIENANSDTPAVVYYSGHGARHGEQYSIVPYDAN